MPVDYEAIKQKLMQESLDDATSDSGRSAIASLIPMAAGVLTGQTSEGAQLGLKTYQTLEDQRQKSRAKLLDYLAKVDKKEEKKLSVSWQKEVDDKGVLRNVAYKTSDGDIVGRSVMGETTTPIMASEEGLIPTPLLAKLARANKAAMPAEKAQNNFQKTVTTKDGVYLITTDANGKELAREKIGLPMPKDQGTQSRFDEQKQKQYAEAMGEIEGYDAIINNLVSYIDKRKDPSLPGVGLGKETASGMTGYPIVGGIASKIAGEENSEDKAFVNNLRDFIRQESLMTGGKALTDNEKKMVQEAIGLMNSGDPEKVRLGIKKSKQVFENVKARIKSGYDPQAVVAPVEKRYEDYKPKQQTTTKQFSKQSELDKINAELAKRGIK